MESKTLKMVSPSTLSPMKKNRKTAQFSFFCKYIKIIGVVPLKCKCDDFIIEINKYLKWFKYKRIKYRLNKTII